MREQRNLLAADNSNPRKSRFSRSAKVVCDDAAPRTFFDVACFEFPRHRRCVAPISTNDALIPAAKLGQPGQPLAMTVGDPQGFVLAPAR